METLPSGLPEFVGDDEALSRFLTQSNQYNQAGVKLVAFLPNPKNEETSVFRHGAEDLPRLWQIGRGQIKDRTLHGAAIVKAHHIRAATLDVVAKEPPARHANIVGWPSHPDPEMEKSERKELAALIAQHAELVRF